MSRGTKKRGVFGTLLDFILINFILILLTSLYLLKFGLYSSVILSFLFFSGLSGWMLIRYLRNNN